ncbi:MAG TPA: hypothetical protein VOA87_13050 [Thermoanaerobaculia bacterium]|nr:hypothetical protein [Thermoanaerobaculia bacterium]
MIVTPPQRAAFLRFCAAIFGLAVAIAIYPLWLRPAPPGQLPGFATVLGIDARASYRFVASLLLLPLAAPLLLRPALVRLGTEEARPWAQNLAALSIVVAIWAALAGLPPLWVVLPTLAVLLACTLLRCFPAGFSRRDVILAPAITTVWIAFLDRPVHFAEALLVAALLVLAVRLLVAIPRRGGLPPAYCFALSPLGLALQSQLFGPERRHAFWPPVLVALATPFLLRLAVPDGPRVRRGIRLALAFLIFPIACIGHVSAYAVMGVEGRPRISVFEEAEHLVPAAEMVRGEKPYRDIIPPHGFVQDAFLDYVLLRAGAPSVGRVMKVRSWIETAGSVVQYAVAAAATGSPEVGLAAAFLANLIATPGGPIRLLPSLAAVALLAWGLRRHSPRAFGLAAAVAALSVLTSLDFGAYAVGTLLVALLRMRRWAYARAALVGAACVAVPVTVAFAFYGILADALRVTLFEIASWRSVYNLGPFSAPPPFKTWHFFPEVLIALFDHTGFLFVVWLAIVAALGAALWRKPLRRWEPAVAIAVWCALNALSYAERQRLTFRFAVAPLLAVVLWRCFRSRTPLLRLAAPLMVFILVMVGQPVSHLAVVAIERNARGIQEPRWTEVPGVPRAQGALFETPDAELVAAAKQYFGAHLAPGDTFFDFMNRGLLYYLFDRDCPLRQVEVAFYEPEARQREVIARIEANPHIRFALLPPANDDCNGVDCVPNRIRAPLVWQYLQQRFTPDLATERVMFWKRK